MTKRLIVAAMLSVICVHGISPGAETPVRTPSPPKIRVAREQHGFADAAGKLFVPFGVTYYRYMNRAADFCAPTKLRVIC